MMKKTNCSLSYDMTIGFRGQTHRILVFTGRPFEIKYLVLQTLMYKWGQGSFMEGIENVRTFGASTDLRWVN